ncbi:hypothetical protein DPSP01_014787 [Paraphaeosphaeria sporulosa]
MNPKHKISVFKPGLVAEPRRSSSSCARNKLIDSTTCNLKEDRKAKIMAVMTKSQKRQAPPSSKRRHGRFRLWDTRDGTKARAYEEYFQKLLGRSTTTFTPGLLQGKDHQLRAEECPRFGAEKGQRNAVARRDGYQTTRAQK